MAASKDGSAAEELQGSGGDFLFESVGGDAPSAVLPQGPGPSQCQAQTKARPKASASKDKVGAGTQSGSCDAHCSVCEEPNTPNSSFCGVHKKGYGCIYRAAIADKGNAKPASDSEWDTELECWSGSGRWFFLKIFGTDKERRAGFRDPAAAQQCILDFCTQFWAGKEQRKVRRFGANFSQYYHSENARQSSEQVDGLLKVYFEIFLGKMKSLRRWSSERAKLCWGQYLADGDVGRDDNGPPWSKTRLFLPSWLFGEDRVERTRCSRMSKMAKMSEEEVTAVRSELARGFKRRFTCDSSVETMHQALMPDSWTLEGEGAFETVTTSSLLQSAGVQAGIYSSTASPAGDLASDHARST